MGTKKIQKDKKGGRKKERREGNRCYHHRLPGRGAPIKDLGRRQPIGTSLRDQAKGRAKLRREEG